MFVKQNQKGFAHLGLVLIVFTVIGIVSFAAYRVGISNKDPSAQNTHISSQAESKKIEQTKAAPASDYTTLNLANSKVSFQIPKTWTVGKSNCIDAPGAVPACSDGATLLPAEKMPTIYGNGTEFFTIYAQAYDNNDNKTAKDWFETSYGGSTSIGQDQTSSESINGYNTYYFKQINESYNEINYVYTASGKAVLVIARVSEKGYASDGSGKVVAQFDFTKYIPEIEKMAKTIRIN